MKILMIHNYFGKSGGAENIMYQEACILKEYGHQVFYYSTDKKPYIEEDYDYADYFPKYIPYFSLSKREKIKHLLKPLYNIEAEMKLDLLLKKIKPDIAHCHCINYQLTSSVINACFKNNIPIVMTAHDVRLVCPNASLLKGFESYCNEELCVKNGPIHCIKNKCVNKNRLASCIAALEHVVNRIHKTYDKVLLFAFPSKSLLTLANKYGINKDKLIVLPNFISNDSLMSRPTNSNINYFLFSGRLTKEKGTYELLYAMNKLPREIKLHIVGTGDEEENLKTLAKELNLDNIRFLGFKSGIDLKDQYRNCIASILPSISYESFGLSIIESFAHSKPVIGSNIGGIPEVIDHGKNGIIVQPRNIDELSSSINKLYSDKNLTIEMGKNGRSKVEKIYNAKQHYKKLIKIYKRAINRNTALTGTIK